MEQTKQTKAKHGKRIAIKTLYIVVLILLIIAISTVVALIVHQRAVRYPLLPATACRPMIWPYKTGIPVM